MGSYDVGYGRPPKSGQIRKGEVRNPHGRAGRKRAAKEVTTDAALLEQIDGETVVVDGRAMTRREAHVRGQYMAALKGRAGAIRYIDQLGQRGASEGQGSGVLQLPCDSPDGWNAKVAIAQYVERLKKDEAKAQRRARRARARHRPDRPLPLVPEWKILAAIEGETVQRDGRTMTMRELRLRVYTALAARGNRAALEVLTRIQTTPPPSEGRRVGYLVVPAPMSLEEWSEKSAKQQAKYREPQNYDELDKELLGKRDR